MLPPSITPPEQLNELASWWQNWVEHVRENPGRFEMVGPEKRYWGEHLFIGTETHKEFYRSARAVSVPATGFADVVEYQEVSDLRLWRDTELNTLLIHEGILSEHCYIVGPSGAGKTSLGIIPILTQRIRGSLTEDDQRSAPSPVVILDLKGDPALFHSVKIEAERRGQDFMFFTTEKNAPTYRFNPFQGFDRGSRTVAQFCQLLMDALSLNHGKGYGRSYYT